jgi:hypothetical protein
MGKIYLIYGYLLVFFSKIDIIGVTLYHKEKFSSFLILILEIFLLFCVLKTFGFIFSPLRIIVVVGISGVLFSFINIFIFEIGWRNIR